MTGRFEHEWLRRSLSAREVRELHSSLLAFLVGQPAPFKDESVGSWGGDSRMTKDARRRRAAGVGK